MATDAQSLLKSVLCQQCNSSNPFELKLMELALLRQILLANNASAVTDPQTLLSQAKCYQCYAATPYALELMELALLVQILQSGIGGGGGGTQQVLDYTASDPNTQGLVPANPNIPAIAYKLGGAGPTYVWNPNTSTWN